MVRSSTSTYNCIHRVPTANPDPTSIPTLTDENGVFGCVHDETELARNPPPFKLPDDDDDEQHDRLCKKGDPNYEMLTKKVFVDLQGHEAAEKRAEHGLARKKRVKIFCLVYTIEKFHDRIPTIRETWG